MAQFRLILAALLLCLAAGNVHGKGAYSSCCTPGSMNVELSGRHRAKTCGYVEGVTFQQSNSNANQRAHKCHVGALLKVNFQKMAPSMSCNRCAREPMCGRRMLKVELTYDKNPGGWNFNIGDSRTNNGWAGDGNTNDNAGELQGKGKTITAYESETNRSVCDSRMLFNLPNALQGVSHVTIYVSNEHVRIVTDRGTDFWKCTRCLYALNGQPDKRRDGVNYDIYVALNRVVAGSYRNGHGVCSARLSWVCPWGQ